MPEAVPTPNHLTGARRMSLTMLAVRDRADGFTGLPRGTAKPLRLLAAFQEAEPYLGLPAHAFKLVSWLVKQTQGQDWEEASRPIAWPSARRQAEFLGLSDARVKVLNRALFEAGIFVIRDNEQGKRYGRRGPDGRIIEAFGFDLSPLAVRYDEFVHIAAAARIERERMRGLRKRVTLARRAIRQAGATLAELGPLPEGWPRLAAETGELVIAARHVERSEDLALIVKALERRQAEAEQWLKETARPVHEAAEGSRDTVETSPEGLENKPHITSTNLSQNPEKDTVIAYEDSSRTARAEPETDRTVHAEPKEPSLRIKPGQLLELAPRLQRYVTAAAPGWSDIVDAADWLRGELGISPTLWRQACRVLGGKLAAVAVAIISTKDLTEFTRSPGGYFAGMVRKAERGELHLEGSLWRLRTAKWGKPEKRQQWH